VAVEEGAAVVEEAITSRKMNAIAHAEQLHSEHVKQRVFIVDLALYLRHGFVHNAPDPLSMRSKIRTPGMSILRWEIYESWRGCSPMNCRKSVSSGSFTRR
jgi:hypothetical protein